MSRLADLAADPRWRRIALALLVLVLLGVGANAVRRAMKGSSSRYDENVAFSRELVHERVDVYARHGSQANHTKYPPFYFLFVAPFVPLPVALGASLWFLLNLAAAVLAIAWAARAVRPPGRAVAPRAWAVPALLLGYIVITNLSTLQVNLVITALVALGVLAHVRGRDGGAGAALGLATALKVTPALLLVWLLARGAWRAVLAAGLVLLLAWGLLPWLVLGGDLAVDATRGWIGVMRSFSEQGILGEGIGGIRQTNQSLSAVLHRLLTDSPAILARGGEPALHLNVVAWSYETVATLVRALTLLLLGGLAWLCWHGPRPRTGLVTLTEIALVVLALLLLSPIAWINHYVALVIPLAVLAEASRRGAPAAPGPRTFWILLVLLAGAVLPILLALSLPFLAAVIVGVQLVRVRLASSRDAPGAPAGA